MKRIFIIFSLIILCSIKSFAQATGGVYPDFPTGGITSAFDSVQHYNINQTTPGQTISLATPANITAGKNLTINNIGTTHFRLIPGGYIMPGTGVILRWTGAWSVTGVGMPIKDHPIHTFYAAPKDSAGTPAFRTIDSTDIPIIRMTKVLFIGTSSQYVKGNGSLGTLPTTKRQETYSGTTNASGVYTVTFGTAYSVAPNIQASITNQSSTNQYLRVSSISTTGFTINAYSFSTNTLLGIVSLTSTTTNINGAPIDVLITEK